LPAALVGRRVGVRIGLDGTLRVLDGYTAVAWHQLRPAAAGWATVPEHHAPLWAAVVEQRPLAVYEEVSQWN
jgi:hypothetical protein